MSQSRGRFFVGLRAGQRTSKRSWEAISVGSQFNEMGSKSGRSWATAQEGQHLLSQIERRAIFQISPDDLNTDRKSVFQTDRDHRRRQITGACWRHPRCQIPIRALFAADQTRPGRHWLGVIMCDSWAGHNREQYRIPARKELFPSFAQLKATFVVAEPLSMSHR